MPYASRWTIGRIRLTEFGSAEREKADHDGAEFAGDRDPRGLDLGHARA
jgi:hypothetical protein